MNDLRSSTVMIIFADISMTILTFLFVGYLFVDLKNQENSHAEVQYKEKGIELPKLKDGNSDEPLSNNQNSLEIFIPKEGGQYIVDGKTILKTELDANLANLKNNEFIISIDQNTPSGDTLYLFDALKKNNAVIKIVFLEEK